jgi:Leucine-rich repeat (LRR) protein
VVELTLVNISSIPPALFCLDQLEVLSLLDIPELSIPPELFNMTLLSALSIVNCDLRTLSEDIVKLALLTELTLDQNRLVALPSTLGKLPSLTSLSINGNFRLSSLDVLNGSTSLITLRGSNCRIDHLPTNIPTLRTIVLDDNQLTSLDGIETMASNNTDLFSFRNNQIKSISTTSLAKIDRLNYLFLSNNLLTTLPDSLYPIKDLKVLDISNNNFDEKESEWIQGVFRPTNTTIVM